MAEDLHEAAMSELLELMQEHGLHEMEIGEAQVDMHCEHEHEHDNEHDTALVDFHHSSVSSPTKKSDLPASLARRVAKPIRNENEDDHMNRYQVKITPLTTGIHAEDAHDTDEEVMEAHQNEVKMELEKKKQMAAADKIRRAEEAHLAKQREEEEEKAEILREEERRRVKAEHDRLEAHIAPLRSEAEQLEMERHRVHLLELEREHAEAEARQKKSKARQAEQRATALNEKQNGAVSSSGGKHDDSTAGSDILDKSVVPIVNKSHHHPHPHPHPHHQHSKKDLKKTASQHAWVDVETHAPELAPTRAPGPGTAQPAQTGHGIPHMHHLSHHTSKRGMGHGTEDGHYKGSPSSSPISAHVHSHSNVHSSAQGHSSPHSNVHSSAQGHSSPHATTHSVSGQNGHSHSHSHAVSPTPGSALTHRASSSLLSGSGGSATGLGLSPQKTQVSLEHNQNPHNTDGRGHGHDQGSHHDHAKIVPLSHLHSFTRTVELEELEQPSATPLTPARTSAPASASVPVYSPRSPTGPKDQPEPSIVAVVPVSAGDSLDTLLQHSPADRQESRDKLSNLSLATQHSGSSIYSPNVSAEVMERHRLMRVDTNPSFSEIAEKAVRRALEPWECEGKEKVREPGPKYSGICSGVGYKEVMTGLHELHSMERPLSLQTVEYRVAVQSFDKKSPEKIKNMGMSGKSQQADEVAAYGKSHAASVANFYSTHGSPAGSEKKGNGSPERKRRLPLVVLVSEPPRGILLETEQVLRERSQERYYASVQSQYTGSPIRAGNMGKSCKC